MNPATPLRFSTQGLTTWVLPAIRPAPTPHGLVLLHGYGSEPADLHPVALEIQRHLPQLHIFLPEGPILLPGDGSQYAWWTIDWNLLWAAASEDPAALKEFCFQDPPELDTTRAVLESWSHAVMDRFKIPAASHLFWGGFSQGAMTATDLCVLSPNTYGGLLSFSGAPIHVRAWKDRVPFPKPVPCFRAHGIHDAVVPFALGAQLDEYLTCFLQPAEFYHFSGGHTIPSTVIEEAHRFLARLVVQ